MSDFRSTRRRRSGIMWCMDEPVTTIDEERCYRAASSRDARFDGWFYVAVRTTGIYCRPSCPAVTPRRQNVEFHRTAASAQQAGFRACKRCRPDASPGSPEWDLRSDTVARAMRLIADGVVDRDGVSGLAARVGYSERHLHRLLTDELGAGPISLARAQRAQTARILIETTDLSMTEVAFAAGFGSVRQFNDTIREVFATAPRELRRRRAAATAEDRGTITVRLPARAPFAGRQLLDFLGAHAVPGVEHYDGQRYTRSIALPRGAGVVTLDVDTNEAAVRAEFALDDLRDLAPAVGRVRRLLDLDADPVAVDAALRTDPALAPLVDALPGIRVARTVDPDETLVRSVIGQQVSLAGARTVTGRIVRSLGTPLTTEHPHVTHLFPTVRQLASADRAALPLPDARAATVQRAAAAIVDGDLALDLAADRSAVVRQLLEVKGIGPWTAQLVAMRALGDPDVFLTSDLVARRALERIGRAPTDTERWRPWRAYAMHHLWSIMMKEF